MLWPTEPSRRQVLGWTPIRSLVHSLLSIHSFHNVSQRLGTRCDQGQAPDKRRRQKISRREYGYIIRQAEMLSRKQNPARGRRCVQVSRAEEPLPAAGPAVETRKQEHHRMTRAGCSGGRDGRPCGGPPPGTFEGHVGGQWADQHTGPAHGNPVHGGTWWSGCQPFTWSQGAILLQTKHSQVPVVPKKPVNFSMNLTGTDTYKAWGRCRCTDRGY